VKLPNWFKIAWWLLLTALITAFLWQRYPSLVAGQAAPADIVVLVVWIALLLAPLFSEISLLGITLKQQIDELKGFVSSQVSEVKSEVRNAVDVRTTFSLSFTSLPRQPMHNFRNSRHGSKLQSQMHFVYMVSRRQSQSRPSQLLTM
jgi:hypothetical protein